MDIDFQAPSPSSACFRQPSIRLVIVKKRLKVPFRVAPLRRPTRSSPASLRRVSVCRTAQLLYRRNRSQWSILAPADRAKKRIGQGHEIFIGSNSWFGGQRVFGLTHSRTGVKPGIPPVPLKGRTLATYLPSASHDLSGKPIPAPLKCHSAGRGTSVPTENTDACCGLIMSPEENQQQQRTGRQQREKGQRRRQNTSGVFSDGVDVEDDPPDREKHQYPPKN